MGLDGDSWELLAEAIRIMEEGFQNLPAHQARPDTDTLALRSTLKEAALRLRDNFPYHHPLYVGQMLKPPHPVARLAYALALHLNPNNHALDGGRASSAMEKEVIAQIAAMFGWQTHLGHLCGGGTMANMEALWVARELRPGKTIAASSQAHYTHERLCGVLGVPFQSVAVDARGRMDLEDLERVLSGSDVGTVVATLGTTAAGAVDPLPEIIRLARARGRDVRVHVDAAYGGYFILASNLGESASEALEAMGQADSIVIDPHKHGLQPYGCGCVLFRDPSVGRVYRHDSPYTYFSSKELHLGEISLECSRPGAAAVALWATMRLLPLERGGEFAQGLEACREAALGLYQALSGEERFAPLFEPELDIVLWVVRSRTSGEASKAARQVFENAQKHGLHLALASFPRSMAEQAQGVRLWDEERVQCLRACVMKPEHREWMPEIIGRLRQALEG